MPPGRETKNRTRKPAAPAKPKGPPPKPAATRAFSAPSTGLKAPPKPKPDKLKDPLTAPFKTTPQQDAGVREIRKRQQAKTDKIILNRVKAGALPNPFTDAPAAPARKPPANPTLMDRDKPKGADPYQVNLTAKVELARANQERRSNPGGLLTPKQAKREREAQAIVTGNPDQRTFLESHDLGDLAKPAVHLDPSAHPHVDRTRKDGVPDNQQDGERHAQPAYGARGGVPNNPYIPEKSGSGWDALSVGLGTALETAASVPGTLYTPLGIRYGGAGKVGSNAHPPVMDVKPTHLGPALEDVTTRAAIASNKGADMIGRIGLSKPDISIPKGEIVPPAGADTTGLPDQIPIDQLGAAGLTPEATAKYTAMAVKRGWYKGELLQLNALDLLTHAYNDPPNVILRTLQNGASGLARTGAAPSAFLGIGKQAFTGHAQQAGLDLLKVAGEFAGQLAHPKEALITDPSMFIPAVGVAGKTAGMAGLLRSAESMGAREIKTGLPATARQLDDALVTGKHASPDMTINRGVYSRNLWTQIGERTSDAAARTLLKNKAMRDAVDSHVRRSAARKGATHQMMALEYKKAMRGLGKGGRKRAEILLALQHAGGDAEGMAAMYENLAKLHPKGDTSPAAGAAKFFRDTVVPATRELTEADQRFLKAHELLSGHTSDALIKLGRFSDTAKVYRAHEPLILAAAHRASAIAHDLGIEVKSTDDLAALLEHGGDAATALREALPEDTAQALHILYLRKARNLDIPADAPRGARMDVRRGKIAEAERTGVVIGKDHQKQLDILNDHPRPVMPKRADDAEYEADLEEWRSIEPKLPKKSKLSPEEQEAKLAPKREAWQKSKPKRPPMTEEERAALAKYRAEKADWDKNWATKHAAATQKERAYRKAADVGNGRASTLKAAESKQIADVPDVEDIRQQYKEAVARFAEHHLENGGMAPTRVAYTKAETVPQQVRRNLGGRSLVAKAPGRQAESTGRSFLEGNYLINAKSPILENLRAQRLEQSIGAYHEVVENMAARARMNDAVPDGMVFVSGSSLGHLGRVEHELESNPVSHGDHYAEENRIRKLFHDTLTGATQKGNHATEDGYFIPKGAWERVLDYAKPVSQTTYDKWNRQYQRTLISIFPGTIIGNTLGTLPLAAFAGAGPHAFRDAIKAHPGLGGDATLAPSTLLGRGVAGGLASDAHHVATRYMDWMREQSVKGEDLGRLAAYFSKAGPYIRKEAEKLNMDADEFARMFAKGEYDPAKLDKFLDHAESFLGDTIKPATATGRQLGKVILFQQWVGHMAKLMLWTMPVKHPRRAALLQIMGQYGNEYRMEHGVWPSWMTDYFPLKHYTKQVPGGIQNMTTAVGLTQLASPQSTAGGVVSNLMEDAPIQDRLASLVAPWWAAAAKTSEQEIKNRYSDADINHADLMKTAINQALGIIPGFRKRYPMTDRKPDDLSIFGMPSYKIRAGRYPGRPLSPFLSPSPQPDRGWKGFAARAFSVPYYESPAGGPITSGQIDKTKDFLRTDERTKRSQDRTRKRKEDVFKRQLAAGFTPPD